jgi:ubiquinol-cytochrome c reductase cytochrome c1 subunit
MKTLSIVGLAAAAAISWSSSAAAAEGVALPAEEWSFNGIFGTFDRAQLQRGYQVYSEVCHACHAMKFLSFRNLEQIGFTPDQVAQIASEFEVQDGPNDEGDMFMRPAKASDKMPSPFPNEQAARFANNGAYPPDQSLIVEARKGGADYIYALMTGYRDPAPEGFKLNPGMYYNEYFPGHQIAMAPPLSDGRVDYTDGTEATLSQQAKDVTAFLTWIAEPNLEARKRMGVMVLLFLLVLTGMLYALKRQIWSDVH